MNYLELITPINLAEEKEKFLRSEAYSPQLAYHWNQTRVGTYRREKPELIPLINALVSQDSQALGRAGSAYFSVVFRPEDIVLAQSLIQTTPKETNGTAEDVADIMSAKLQELGIDYRTHIVDRHGFQCRPDHKVRVVRISKHLQLQFLSAESVVNHELVHIIRAVNGNYNNIAVQPNYLPTEEGLACLMQDKLFRGPSGSTFQHALEYMASHLSRQASFREVYDFLRSHGCNAEVAWLRGIRQKFGLRDTWRPGGLMKSGMYFYHEQLLRELDRPSLIRLFVGKIPLAQLTNYPTYSGALPAGTIEKLLA